MAGPTVPPARFSVKVLPGVLLLFGPDGTLAACAEPRACARCGEPHALFVNRGAATRCLFCDDRAVRSPLGPLSRCLLAALLALLALLALAVPARAQDRPNPGQELLR